MNSARSSGAGRARRSAGVLSLVLGAALGAGCVARPTIIGPFVRNISRVGSELRIESCEIILEGSILREGVCSLQRIQLHTAPPPAPSGAMPAPAPRPPSATPAVPAPGT